MDVLRRIFELFGRWPVALAAATLLAALVLLPGLGDSGLWDQNERPLADRVAPPTDSVEPAKPPAAKNDGCERTAPDGAVARSLTTDAVRWGRDTLGDSDRGRRLPLALLGLLTAIALAATAVRIGGARAAVTTAIVLVAMPLMTLQSRSLTSEIGTACGATLIVYGFVAICEPSQRLRALDLAGAAFALALGLLVGFAGGGALLGVLVPVGAVALATIGHYARPSAGIRAVAPALATAIAVVTASVLAYQLYQLVTPYPGLTPPPAREVFGKAIVADGCWSTALGGLWRADDDLRYVFDSSFEQIAYGTFPWGIIAPLAMYGLMRSEHQRHRLIGGLTIAWAGGAWIAQEVFHRKVGFTIWSGFPALALATGVWLDDLIARRASGRDALSSAAAMLLAAFGLLAVIAFGRDLQSFTDRLSSLLVGGETIQYPKDATIIVSPRLWILIIGGCIALAFAIGLAVWHPAHPLRRRIATLALAAALACSVVLAAFWAFVWQPVLSQYLSSKALFATYNRERSETAPEPLLMTGDLGFAPASYAAIAPQKLPSRDQVVAQLKKAPRVFAVLPQSDLCLLHREMADAPYFVLYAKNLRSLLVSNQLGGSEDENPLRDMIAHKPPTVAKKPKGRIVWDNKIELIGWDVPERVDSGDTFELVTYYKILAPVGGSWQMLVHIDGPVRMRDGDHKPIKDRCPTTTWMHGDYIIDRHPISTAGNPSGRYDIWIGFFTGAAPSFRNMTVSAAPGDLTDSTDRIKLGQIVVD